MKRAAPERGLGEGVAQHDVVDRLALDHHVRLADGVGRGVDLLAQQVHLGGRVQGGDLVVRHGEHAAGAGRGVVHLADQAGDGEVRIIREQQGDHEVDDLARGEVLTRGLVGGLRELADQLLEDVTHLVVADGVRVEVGLGEVLEDLQQQVVVGEVHDGVLEPVLLEDLPHVRGERVDVVPEVFLQVVRIALHGLEVVLRAVKEAVGVARAVAKHGDGRLHPHVHGADGLQYRLFRRGQHRIQAEEDRERQDHVPVLVLLVGAAEDVRGTPDEGCVVEHLWGLTW